jgi:hypothetical protein
LTDQPRPRRIGRRALLLAAVALAGSTAFLTWWTTTLMGLPDVGDPFDVEAFSRPIPDETNAFVLYKQAAAILPNSAAAPRQYDWKTASPGEKDWLDRSREALSIWRKGTERPDALYLDPSIMTFETKVDVAQSLRSFCHLALLEGSRLEDAGDMEGSLDWSLALLRCSRHCGRRGTFIERLIGVAMHRLASDRLVRWAADPRVDARLLRRALDASIATDTMTAPNSDGLKVECLSLLRSIGDPELMIKVHVDWRGPNSQAESNGLFGMGRWKSNWIRVRRRSINDPERSRRVIRMIFANWLAYCDLPPSRQPPKAIILMPSTTLTGPARAILSDLFAAGPEAPAAARALPPEKLAAWFASTVDAEACMPAAGSIQKAIARERSAQDALLFTLAKELYRREHGCDPEKNEDLVGPYLKTLPEAYKSAR